MSAPRGRAATGPVGARTRIDDAAEELFATLGFGATSMADIATRAGVSNGSLFHHYPTKVDLAAHVWARAYLEKLELTSLPIAEERTHEAIVRAIVHGHAASIVAQPRRSLLLMTQEPPASVAQRYVELHRASAARFAAEVEQWLARAADDGAIHRLTFDTARALIIGPVNDLGRRWLLGRTAATPLEVVSVLADGAWAAVAAPRVRARARR